MNAGLADLDPGRVAALLGTARLGRSLSIVETTESTNDDARRAAGAGCPDGHVVVADSQSHGRGSRGRTWSSPPGTDLYISAVARLSLPAASMPPLTLVVGLAVAEALEPFVGGARLELKWPNDVWVDGKKLVGILVESASSGDRVEPVVIGIGINVNRETFPSDLEVRPTSLRLEAKQRVDRSTVLAALLDRLEVRIDRFAKEGPSEAIAAVNERLALRGQEATCGDIRGWVEQVAPSGALLMRNERGLIECVAGTLRPCETPALAPA